MFEYQSLLCEKLLLTCCVLWLWSFNVTCVENWTSLEHLRVFSYDDIEGRDLSFDSATRLLLGDDLRSF